MAKYLAALDDGHGMETPGKRTPLLDGKVMKENEFNSAVVGYIDIELKRCGIDTLLVAPTDYDTPLATRVNLANTKKADIYVSIHANAFDSKFDNYDPEGLEVFYYEGSVKGKKLAECVHKYLIQGTPQKDRGIKKGNHLYVIRVTKMPAVLIEAAFMDNKREAKLLMSDEFRKEVAIEVSKGICEYFGVSYKEPSKNEFTLAEAIKYVQENTKFETQTMQYLQAYKYYNSLLIKMAQAIYEKKYSSQYKNMNINEQKAIEIVKKATGFEDKTIEYLKDDYKYGSNLIVKLAQAMI